MTKIKYEVLKMLFLVFRVFRIKKNRIVISNFYGKGYGDNGKYIVEELLKKTGTYDIIWLVHDLDTYMPEGVCKVKINSVKAIYAQCTAKIWIDNTRKREYILKRKNQFYIQTWHSPLRLKKIELDAIDSLGKDYMKVMEHDSNMIDVILCGCDFSYNIYRNSFLYYGKIEKTGTPRCDIFFNDDLIQKSKDNISKMYNLSNQKKIVLYAPTFRKQDSDYLLDFQTFLNNFENDYHLLVRAHPGSAIEISSSLNVIDVTNYPDMQDLLNSADILITDYSSCCFDMLIANKPCFLFTKDLSVYRKNERDLYFDFDELPFIICDSDDSLIKSIKSFDLNNYILKTQAFKNRIGLYENGQASYKVKRIIEDVMEEHIYEKI